MYRIDKTFEFCYGHRVWTQLLDGRYSDDLKCACRHLHGHEAKVQVFLSSDDLNPQGMVTDFRHLEWLKRWLNFYVDHKFILHLNDPLYAHLLPEGSRLEPLMLNSEQGSMKMGYLVVNPTTVDTPYLNELVDGMLVLDFVPTSENLARWLFECVDFMMSPLRVKTLRVDWWETPRSRSSYSSPVGQSE